MAQRRQVFLDKVEAGKKAVAVSDLAGLEYEEAPEEYQEMPLAPAPTVADPGSEAKIKIMTERVEKGFKPCHPGDMDLLTYEHLQRRAEKLNNGRRRLEAMQCRNGRSDGANATNATAGVSPAHEADQRNPAARQALGK